MNTDINIPKERTYKINAGNFRAKIENVFVKKANGKDDIECSVHFIADIPGMERYDCCARAVFPFNLNPRSPLRTFLEGLLGAQYFTDRSGSSINLASVLCGVNCAIEVIHGPHNEDKYDWPLVLVVSAKATAPLTQEATTK